MTVIPRHRCEEAACTYFGQPTDRGCACHKTVEQMLVEQRDELLAALKAAAECLIVMEEMTECRSDDEWVWAAQEKVKSAIAKVEALS